MVIVVCATAVGLLLVGAVAHVTDLLHHGLQAYDWAPRWLNFYWSSLALLDLLAAAYLVSGKRRGIELACAIMTTDLRFPRDAECGDRESDGFHERNIDHGCSQEILARNKSKHWVTARYFGMFNKARRDRWVFGDRDSGRYLAKFSWTKIVRHQMVKGTSSVDDPALADYWAERRRRHKPAPAYAREPSGLA
ncbi:hypothetical protein [Streptomyces atratus]|uniref:hypothetical protein n=1 Tax=Streptomyces atratus TaxID=1893 RepID=UPI003666FC1B